MALCKPLEIYLHIPFCVRKCDYCDFLSAPADKETKHAYMKALCKEIEAASPKFKEYETVSVFVGGGTPTTVAAEDLCEALSCVKSNFRLGKDCEITVEMNPGTVDREKLTALKNAGVNRLSIGLQSPQDRELKAIGRIHSFEQFLDCYKLATALGFDNINIDMMSALPGQTVESYTQGLRRVLALTPAPKHISAYSLILEEGTPLKEKIDAGLISPVEEDTDREMYLQTGKILAEAGYIRYEISNYSKPGFRCRHNIGYWTGVEYAGFGIGAASLVEHTRCRNTSDLKTYLADPLCPKEDVQELSRNDRMEEFMFLGLRLTDGISVAAFEQLFGVPLAEVYGEVVEKNRKDGLLRFSEDGERLFLTERGLDLSNYVYAQFLFS